MGLMDADEHDRLCSLRGQVMVAEMRGIADEASDKAVAKMLTALGFDVSDPKKSQEDMAAIRQLVGLGTFIKTNSLRSATALITVALLGALWMGFEQIIARIAAHVPK